MGKFTYHSEHVQAFSKSRKQNKIDVIVSCCYYVVIKTESMAFDCEFEKGILPQGGEKLPRLSPVPGLVFR